jgi:hypothetical protein
MEGVAVGVQVHDLALLDAGSRPARAGLEGPLHDVALPDVLQLHADLRRPTRHLDVRPVQHLHQLAVQLDDDPLLDVPGADQVVVSVG